MNSKGCKHGGLYITLSPTSLIVDLDYLKNIMARDFHYFDDRGKYYNKKTNPLSARLFAIGGLKWRHLWTKFNPTFTSGKIKMMFQTLVNCVPNLLEKMDSDRGKGIPINIKGTTTDVIGFCAFGLDCSSYKDENSPFKWYSRRYFFRIISGS